MRCDLEPVVGNTAPVSGKIVERVQSIEVVDGDLRHGVRLCKTQVHGDPQPSFLVPLQPAPEGHAAAGGAKVKFEGLAPDIRLRLARDLDAFILKVVCPEDAITSARRAVAGRCTVGLAVEYPPHFATEAGSLNHRLPSLLASSPRSGS